MKKITLSFVLLTLLLNANAELCSAAQNTSQQNTTAAEGAFAAEGALALRGKEEALKLLLEKAKANNFKDTDSSLRYLVETLKWPAHEAVPQMIQFLQSPAKSYDEAIFQAAVVSRLGDFKNAARPAIPALIRVLERKSEYHWLPENAASALCEIAPASPEVVKALSAALHNPSLTAEFSRILTRLGPGAKPMIPAMLQFIKTSEPSDYRRGEVFSSLVQIEARLPQLALPEAIKNLQNVKALQVGQAAKTFAAVQVRGIQGRVAIPVLMRIVRTHDDWIYRDQAMETLGAVGPGSSREATKFILEIIAHGPQSSNGNGELYSAATAALQMHPGDMAVVPLLADALEAAKPEVQSILVRAIAQIGPAAYPAVDSLVEVLKEVNPKSNSETTLEYLRTLSIIGPKASKAVPVLLDVYEQHRNWLHSNEQNYGHKDVVTNVFTTIARIGVPTDKKLHPRLQKVIQESLGKKDLSSLTAIRAARVLGKDGEVFVPQLIEVLSGKERWGVPYETDHIVRWGYVASTSPQIEAALTLTELGDIARPALPALQQFLKEWENSTSLHRRVTWMKQETYDANIQKIRSGIEQLEKLKNEKGLKS